MITLEYFWLFCGLRFQEIFHFVFFQFSFSFLFKDVRANCFCVSLLRTKFTRHVMHRACALSSKVNNNRANDDCYNFAWINDLGTVTPIFLSMGYFLYRNSKFCEKMKKIYQVEVWTFCETLIQIPFRLASPSSFAAVSHAKVCENDGNIWNY